MGPLSWGSRLPSCRAFALPEWAGVDEGIGLAWLPPAVSWLCVDPTGLPGKASAWGVSLPPRALPVGPAPALPHRFQSGVLFTPQQSQGGQGPPPGVGSGARDRGKAGEHLPKEAAQGHPAHPPAAGSGEAASHPPLQLWVN